MWRFLSVLLVVSGLTAIWAGYIAMHGYHDWHQPFPDEFVVLGGLVLTMLANRLPTRPAAARWPILGLVWMTAFAVECLYLGACYYFPKQLPAAFTAHIFMWSLAMHVRRPRQRAEGERGCAGNQSRGVRLEPAAVAFRKQRSLPDRFAARPNKKAGHSGPAVLRRIARNGLEDQTPTNPDYIGLCKRQAGMRTRVITRLKRFVAFVIALSKPPGDGNGEALQSYLCTAPRRCRKLAPGLFPARGEHCEADWHNDCFPNKFHVFAIFVSRSGGIVRSERWGARDCGGVG